MHVCTIWFAKYDELQLTVWHRILTTPFTYCLGNGFGHKHSSVAIIVALFLGQILFIGIYGIALNSYKTHQQQQCNNFVCHFSFKFVCFVIDTFIYLPPFESIFVNYCMYVNMYTCMCPSKITGGNMSMHVAKI
jgi:hypothetical protein